jgi:hypothetical protein
MKKRRSISVTTPAINAFGTAVPSLNRRGKSNSKRQYALIGGRAIDGERNPLTSHRTKSLLRHSHFPSRPGVAIETANQELEGPPLRDVIWKSHDDHHG